MSSISALTPQYSCAIAYRLGLAQLPPRCTQCQVCYPLNTKESRDHESYIHREIAAGTYQRDTEAFKQTRI